VFDATSRESFEHCTEWINRVTEASPSNKDAEVLLVANKVDLRQENPQFVDSVGSKEYAERRGYKYFECSAKKNQGVASPFQYMASKTCERYKCKMQ
jgi:GTPase SAR1 family protein